jgi:sugar transferase (PEP-CTERM/EpsH1 system associated)
MKLFIITSRIPFPLDKGDKLRIYHQMKSLAKDHDVYLCALQLPFSKQNPAAYQELKAFCKEVFILKLSALQILLSLTKALATKTPFQTALFTTKTAKKTVHNLVQKVKPEHIYCQLTRAAEYVKNAKEPKTIDYMDVFSKGMERRAHKAPLYLKWLYLWEASKQRNYERSLFGKFNNHTIITKEDRAFVNHPKNLEIKIIKNGVDFAHFKPQKTEIKYDIVFVGNMGYAPNIDAAEFLCKDLLPILQKEIPKIKILLAGTQPSKAVLKLQSNSVTVSGWMQDIRKAYASSTLFIAPMRIGTGLQNKLLEAMAMNKPCISTSLAANPINAPEQALLVGNTKEELAALSLELLQNEAKRTQVSTNGHEFVKNTFEWSKTTEELNKLFYSN